MVRISMNNYLDLQKMQQSLCSKAKQFESANIVLKAWPHDDNYCAVIISLCLAKWYRHPWLFTDQFSMFCIKSVDDIHSLHRLRPFIIISLGLPLLLLNYPFVMMVFNIREICLFLIVVSWCSAFIYLFQTIILRYLCCAGYCVLYCTVY